MFLEDFLSACEVELGLEVSDLVLLRGLGVALRHRIGIGVRNYTPVLGMRGSMVGRANLVVRIGL